MKTRLLFRVVVAHGGGGRAAAYSIAVKYVSGRTVGASLVDGNRRQSKFKLRHG